MASDLVQAKMEIKSAGMSRNYFCVECKCTTRNPRLYLEHRRDFHKEPISIHECKLCIYASKHSQKLARHLRTVHRDVVQNITVHSAWNPSFNSPTPDGFQSVINTGKNTRLSTCKLCGLYTVNKTILIEHVRAQHPDVQIFECDQCDYTHYIRDRYNRHHRYHSMNQIQCKMCEFQTIYRWNLERHMRHHVDNISLGFRCNKCNFTASTKQSITAHEIAHHSGLQLHGNLIIKSETNILPDEVRPSISTAEPQLKQEHFEDNTIDKNDNDTANDNANNADTQTEEGSDFDASDFLEVVMDEESQPTLNNTNFSLESTTVQWKNITIKQEMPTEPKNSQNTSYFHCVNCNFRNEIEVHSAEERPQILPKTKIISTGPIYRCGYCHQKSQWKHVIERHCRLVHSSIANIEKYSVKDDTFKTFTPTKRRLDPSTDNFPSPKKQVKDDNIEMNSQTEIKPFIDTSIFQNLN
ncbi:RE1-silencing transcription factor B-like [Contarinia nasturtii]|uniref:RE1-silencing transcription factor B-like n=1 Tax=Contarinia nasturtii TaxID=265458 RepID=UPI0012D49412|nr:RE1-silencing transcription factor B-like [Contarinia nasturtii]